MSLAKTTKMRLTLLERSMTLKPCPTNSYLINWYFLTNIVFCTKIKNSPQNGQGHTKLSTSKAMQMRKSCYDTITKKLSFTLIGLNLILSLSPILRSTRMISLHRLSRLTNPRSRLLFNHLMMTFTPRKTIYCLHSWRLPILYLPLQLLNRRRKFLLAAVFASCPAHLLLHNLCRSTKHLPLCALARAHTRKLPLTLLPPNSAL